MPQLTYVNWLLRVTVPADDHQVVRVMEMMAPDDELRLLERHIPRLNKDMRLVGRPEKFGQDETAKFEETKAAWTAEAKAKPGFKEPGPLDIQLTQAQVDKIKADREAAMGKLSARTSAPAPKAVKPNPANG